MKTILVVDDSTTMLTSIRMILQNHTRLEIASAVNGAEALAILEGGLVPAMILTDVNMPKMNGIEFTRSARQLRATRFTPILIITTESQQAMRDEGKKAGATGWLVKPVEPTQLLGAIKKFIPDA